MARYALVVGIANYEKFTKLHKAAVDAEAIAQILEQHRYTVTRLPRKLLSENQWEIDSNQKLTPDKLIQELKTFLQERAHQQEAVIYIASHGFRVLNFLTDEQEGYLATYNSTREGHNAIKFDDLNKLISKSELASLVMLLDCCYAGSFLEEQRNLLQTTQSTFNQKQNYCLIAACRDFEKAREGEKHGIFTAAVLEGLKLENAKNGMITSANLFDFVSQELDRSGQEVTHAAQGKPIPLLEYAIPTSLQNSPAQHQNKIEKALEAIQSNFELLDQKFFENFAQKKGRSQILHLPAATWSLILQGNYIERDQQGELLDIAERLAKFDGISLLLIRGEPGAGKTALMRWLAYELFRQGKRIFQKKSDCEIGWLDQLGNFSEQIHGEHFYVIFDDIFRDDLILDELKQNEFLFPLTLIGTTRLNEDQHESLSGWEYEIKCLDVARPSEAEKTKILNKVSEIPTVKNRLEKMTLKEKQQLINSPILLVLMLQLSEGKTFDQIIADIIKNLPNSQQRPIYQIFGVICCFFQYGMNVPLEILKLCLPEFNFSEKLIQTELEGLIDTAIYSGFEGLTTIHELIAKTAMQVDYKLRSDRENQPYSWVENPSLLAVYLKKIINSINSRQPVNKQYLYHVFLRLALRGEISLVSQFIQEYKQKIEILQQENDITAWNIWAKIYQLLGLTNEQKYCLNEIARTEPQNQDELELQLSILEKIVTRKQLQEAITKTQIWLQQHPDDFHVRQRYLTLVERYGKPEQRQETIEQTQLWLQNNSHDVYIRTKYLRLIERYGKPEQRQETIEQTQFWLQNNYNNSSVRTKYLGLIERYGKPEQKQESIAQTQLWLQNNLEDTSVRVQYLALIKSYGTNEQKQKAINQTKIWLQQHPNDLNVHKQYLTLIETCGTNEQKQEAINQTKIWLQENLENTSVYIKYLSLIKKIGTSEQKQEAIPQAQTWLQENLEDTSVRVQYLALIKSDGTNEQKQEAITQTHLWLKQHTDDIVVRKQFLALIQSDGNDQQKKETIAEIGIWLQQHSQAVDIRRQYLALVGKVSKDNDEIQVIISQQWQWIQEQIKVNEDLWTVFIPVLYYHSNPSLLDKATNLALKQYPDSAQINTLIFSYFHDYLDYETCYKLACKITDSPLDSYKWRKQVLAANFLRDYGHLEIAEKVYTKILKSTKKNLKQGESKIDMEETFDLATFNYANLLLMKEPPEQYQATKLLESLLKRNPNHSFAHWLIAKCYQIRGKRFYNQAIVFFEQATRFDTEKKGFFWHDFGCFYWDYMNNIHKARSCFEKSLIQKTNLSACISLAELELEAGNVSSAKAALQKGLNSVPITRPEKEEREKLNPRIQALQQHLDL